MARLVAPVCPLEVEVVPWEPTGMLFSPWVTTTFFLTPILACGNRVAWILG